MTIKNRSNYQPTNTETLPQRVLRLRPTTEAEMEAALTGMAIGLREAWDLKREIKRLSSRGAYLIRHNARPQIIDRYTEELRLLNWAAEALEIGGAR